MQFPDDMDPAGGANAMMAMLIGQGGSQDEDDFAEEDGAVDYVDREEDEAGLPERSDEEHQQNLCELLTDQERKRLGERLRRYWEADKDARLPWERAAKRGFEAMGLLAQMADEDVKSDATRAPGEISTPHEPWQSRDVAPLLTEGVMRLSSSLQKEFARPNGMWRGKVISTDWASEELDEQAKRVGSLVNLYYNDDDLMPDGIEGMHKLIQTIVSEGGAVREPYWDTSMGGPDVATHTLDKVWMPWDARSLYRARRVTVAFPLRAGTIRRMQKRGYYAEIDSLAAGINDEAGGMVDEAVRAATGFTAEKPEDPKAATVDGKPVEGGVDADEIIHCGRMFVFLEQPNRIDGGLSLPYRAVLTPDGQILRLERDWKNGDPYAKRLRRMVMYGMMPVSRCPYPIGIHHAIGFLGDTATNVLRKIIDATYRSMRSTTFVGNEVQLANMKDAETCISPNGADELIQMPFGGIDFKNSLVTLKSDPPTAVAFNLLGMLKDTFEKAINTNDLMAGTAQTNNAPVGTTMLQIEQGSRVYSAFHRRVHTAARSEAKAFLVVLRDNIDPQATYPMQVSKDGEPVLILPDIDERIDVEPVSDPAEFSDTVRIAKAQAMFQAYKEDPSGWDGMEVKRRLCDAIGLPDVDALLPDTETIPRCDVVTENQKLLVGKPIRAYWGQVHDAHMAEHQRFFASLPPEAQKMLQAVFMAHMGEHLMLKYREQAAQVMARVSPQAAQALMVQPDVWSKTPGAGEPQLLPEQERMLDQAVAMTMAQAAPPPPPPGQEGGEDPQMIKAKADALRASTDAQAKQNKDKRERQAHELDMQQKRLNMAKGLQGVAQNAAASSAGAERGSAGAQDAGSGGAAGNGEASGSD